MPDSGYAFAQTAFDNGNNTLLIGRLDKNGNVVWIKQVDDSETIRAGSIALSPDGYLYATFSARAGQTWIFPVVLKFDLSGNLVWSKSYGNSNGHEQSEHIFVTASAIYVAGEVYSISGDDLYVLKIDLGGTLIWGRTYDMEGELMTNSILLNNGDLLLCGWTYDSHGKNYSSFFRIDSSGAIIWSKRFNTPSYERFIVHASNEDFSGDLLLSGYVDSVDTGIGFGKWDILFMKLSSTGDFKWAKIYGGSDWDEGWFVAPTNDNGYMMGVEPESFGNVPRIGLLKTDSIGNVEWMRLYGEASGGFPNNFVMNKDNGYTILAKEGDFVGQNPMILISIDSTGKALCGDSLVSIQTNSFQPVEESLGTSISLTGFAPFTPIIADYPLTAQDYCPFQPCDTLTLSFTVAVAIPGLTNGAMRVFVSGGEPPYNYSLDSLTFQTSNTFKFLDLGTYQVYVTDSNGCTGQGTFTIDETNCNCGRH